MSDRHQHVLVLAPHGSDAGLLEASLERAGIRTVRCATLDDVRALIDAGAGALILTEEALVYGSAELVAALDRQPAWSDLPLVLMTSGGETTRATLRAVELLGQRANVTLLERPVRAMTLISTVESALRARRRQYDIRDHVEDLSAATRAIEEASRRKDEFLGMLAHELRNPLAPLTHALELARYDRHRERALEIAGRQVHRLARLVDDLLDVSRITRGKVTIRRERVSLRALVERVVEVMRPMLAAHDVVLGVSLPPEDVALDGDPVRLEQVLTNLLINAAKYTDRGGHVSLAARAEDARIRIVVRDDGIGIAPDMLDSVFDLFVQADCSLDRADGGLGIGLTMVKQLVELHGGSVEAHSEGIGYGSEFVVHLPLAAGPPASAREPSRTTPDRAPHGRLSILVVDDNVDVAETTATVLNLDGHAVSVAHDGREALVRAREVRPDVVLLDIGLPGIDGYEVARALRAEPVFARTVLVAVSGYGREEDRRRARAAGFDGHLLKPVAVEDLRRVLVDLTERRDTWPHASAG